MKKNETNKACSTHREDGNCEQNFKSENSKRRKTPLARHKYRWHDVIKMVLK
jgi:hypothetical protein